MINKRMNRPYFAFVNYCFVVVVGVGGGSSKLKVNLTAVFVFCALFSALNGFPSTCFLQKTLLLLLLPTNHRRR